MGHNSKLNRYCLSQVKKKSSLKVKNSRENKLKLIFNTDLGCTGWLLFYDKIITIS